MEASEKPGSRESSKADRADGKAEGKPADGRPSVSENKPGSAHGLSRFKKDVKRIQLTQLRSQSTLGALFSLALYRFLQILI